MKRRTGLYATLCIFLVVLTGSGIAQTDAGPLAVYVGTTIFNNPDFDSLALVVFPFSFERAQLDFFMPDSLDTSWYSRVFAQVTLYGADGMPADSTNTYFSVRVASAEEAAQPDFTLFNSLSLMARPGVYSGRLTVIDVVSKRKGDVFLDEIVVVPPQRDRLAIGATCLAYKIERAKDEDPSDRLVYNGYRVFTNPLGIFNAEDSAVYLYAEVYNLSFSEPDSGDYSLSYAALDQTGAVYKVFGGRVRSKPGSSVVVTERFDVAGWPTGDYHLRIIAADLVTGEADTAVLTMHRIRGMDPGWSLMKAHSPDPYDTLSYEVKRRLVTYLLTPAQKVVLNGLTPEGKENFLDQFWRDHDIDPTTRAIENRLEMIQRYNFAVRYFSFDEGSTNGWSSDRGRIYMTYGPYEEKDEDVAPDMGNPFIVWYYHSLEGGSVFVFEDLRGFYEYNLVHSNMEGERFNTEWSERLGRDFYWSK